MAYNAAAAADDDDKLQVSLNNLPKSSNFSHQEIPKMAEPRTDWPSVWLISAILFFGMVQMSVIGMSEWPYMKQIDPLATSTFFGYVGSVSSLGHAVCAPLMGYWSSATGQTKLPLIVGRLIALVGCVLYLCLELFPHGRRYVMLVCYTIFGISMSSASVMRGYVAKISTVKDRTMAVSLFGLAIMLAVTVGPLFQLVFTSLAYPGHTLIENMFYLNIYTGPVYVATLSNIISLILVLFVFKDKKSIHQQVPQAPPTLGGRKPSRAVEALTTDMRAFDLSLALSCIFVRMVLTLTISTIHTTTSPLMMSAFGWSNLTTVKVSSYTQAVVGTLSLLIFIGFASGKLTKMISERCSALIAILLLELFFVLTYPWEFLGGTIRIKDGENSTGCDAVAYKWCKTSHAVSPAVYIGSTITVLGVAFTLSTIAVDAIYSKILGNIDQGTMQGVFLFGQDIVSVCGPLLIAPVFTNSGQKYIWLVDGVIIAIVCFRWIAVYKRLPKSETVLGKWLKKRCTRRRS